MPDHGPSSHYDFIVIGSGFGGSVSALRLREKGYDVLVLEKGRRFAPEDFPKTNWDLRRWMWMPQAGLHGIFQMSFFEHLTVLHGVGVGGGSLVYANTLPTPKDNFFSSPSWSGLADWKTELAPHYRTAQRMLGATTNPRMTRSDHVLKSIARDIGREEHFAPTEVAVYFGDPGRRVKDPFFEGEGPDRVGCTYCGACMTGCRVGAKNTLDRNYLYLAEKRGVRVEPETEVTAVRAREAGGGKGRYRVETRPSPGSAGGSRVFTADNVVFAGGVLGTVPLLLAMAEDRDGLPNLSKCLGESVRTNSEALIGVVVPEDRGESFSRGVAITSILHTDDHSHIEPVRYGAGSGFFRTLMMPHAAAPTPVARMLGAVRSIARQPLRWARTVFMRDFASHSTILLYMRTLEGTLSVRLGRSPWTAMRRGLVTKLDATGAAPTAMMPEADDLATRFADKVGGVKSALLTETLMGVPTTAHILGGCCMGRSAGDGVIDSQHRVFGYDGLFVIDGSAVSANPGVNPSLTITALAERAMSFVPMKA